jgi:hypothetical protein
MAKSTLSTPKTKRPTWAMTFTKQQYLMLGAGIGVILIGFALLSTGIGGAWDNVLALDVAPVLLVLGYCVIIPFALIGLNKRNGQDA